MVRSAPRIRLHTHPRPPNTAWDRQGDDLPGLGAAPSAQRQKDLVPNIPGQDDVVSMGFNLPGSSLLGVKSMVSRPVALCMDPTVNNLADLVPILAIDRI